MGNSSRKPARERRAALAARTPGLHPNPRRRPQAQLRPQDGDVLYPATDLLHTSEATLAAMRDQIGADAEGFLLDNLLMAVQYFENYEQEAAALRKAAGLRSASLCALACRVTAPDALAEAAGRHVRWRPRGHDQPDSLPAAARRVVLSDSVLLHDDLSQHGQPAQPCPDGAHHHLAVEDGPKPGLVKLRRLRRPCTGDDDEDAAGDLADNVDSYTSYLRVPSPARHGSGSCPRRGGAGSRAPSPSSSVKSWGSTSASFLTVEAAAGRGGRPRSVVDSVISSEGSTSAQSMSTLSLSLSDLSSSGQGGQGRHRGDRHIPLDEFRPGRPLTLPDALPAECFQAVLTTAGGTEGNDDSDDDDAAPAAALHELRVHSYLLAAPYFACFADAFHDHVAEAMGFPRESVVLATVRGGGAAPAAVLCEEASTATLCEVTPALPLSRWPAVASEWVYRERAAWPSRPTVRAVHGLGAVAVPAGSADLSGLQWALAFPDGERLLELSLTAAQAHGYLTLMALLRSVPGVSVAHLRALYLRQCERTAGTKADGGRDWAPGRALRDTLGALYSSLQQRQLRDYFVRDRNLLAELPTSQVRRAQERVFRLREKLLPSVVQACRRLAYVREDRFYPRLDLDRLVAVLSSRDGDGGQGDSPAGHDQQDHDDLDWIESYRRRCLEANARQAAAARNTNKPSLSKVTIKLGPHTNETRQRTISVVKLFCDHFIKMAEASLMFKANEQAWLYLRHSLHLLTILDRDYGCEADARLFNSRVRTAERKLIDYAMTSLCGREPSIFGSLGNLPSFEQKGKMRHTFGSANILDMLSV